MQNYARQCQELINVINVVEIVESQYHARQEDLHVKLCCYTVCCLHLALQSI